MEVDMLKRTTLLLLSAALVVAAALAGVWVYGLSTRPALAQTPEAPAYNPSRTITVVGQGTSRVQPDVAQVTIGVETLAGTVSEAVKENDAKMQAILAALKQVGIADKDVQTSNYSISSERSGSVPLPEGGTSDQGKAQYRVSNMVNVTIRDLSKVSTVLDSVVEAGANNVWGVSFSVDDPKQAESAARSNAIADAQVRAEELARLGSVKLGPIMSISETISGSAVPMAVKMEVAQSAGGTPISVGEVEVTYQAQVVYYIEP
jgi:uncharacterized protein YggE